MHLLLKFSWQTGTLNGKNQERVILNPRVRSANRWSPWSRQRLEVKGPLDQEVIIKKENTISTSSSKTKGHFSSVQALSCVQVFATPGLHHARLPCASPTPKAYSNSCPLSWWCHPTISSSVIPFSSFLQSFPASGSFPMSQFFASSGQNIGVSASASVLSMNIQERFPLGWTD